MTSSFDAILRGDSLRVVFQPIVTPAALAIVGYEGLIRGPAGSASLRLWLELRPPCVKLDNAFVRGVDADPLKRSFLDLVQQLVRCAGARLIAEGVETARELDAASTTGPVGSIESSTSLQNKGLP
jgi:EAL domain-containing protein (putative c-di-GMP-specific phosphodiesterase class I)